ncbi:hypothetical protein TSA6c_00615 [Azospirillum sp. TSA6c]|uniref:hypothetical protein n=1 Tax=Azospirillum sp. TSA6c TaxID=709813 RepID=UPI000D6152FE|nr:hypothetical protein [Azospirillum sp. TSA6c]PWC54258.1 hypothetical protein TSA6c_00615 [Azospirillum sp. TSA6c]
MGRACTVNPFLPENWSPTLAEVHGLSPAYCDLSHDDQLWFRKLRPIYGRRVARQIVLSGTDRDISGTEAC